MKKLLMIVLTTSTLFVTACNTLHGAGKDVKSVGECVDGKKGNC